MSDQLTPPPVLGPTMPVQWPPAAEQAPQPAPDARTEPAPATPEQPAPPSVPSPEEKRARAAAKKAAVLRVKERKLQRSARLWATVVIAISTLITIFGSGNAHDVLSHHNTPEPWGWFLYPALEAALIVEIQIGGALAEHNEPVVFWGAGLRVVTALAAITLCIYGPAEAGDVGGAVLHALGPFVQFWLAEFLAAARRRFKAAVEKVAAQADGREQQAVVSVKEQPQRSRKRSPKTTGSGPDTEPKTTAGEQDQDRSPDQGTGPELVLTPIEKKALASLQKKSKRVSKRTVIEEVRALGGAIGTTRALQIAREWGPDSGGPELSLVEQKEA